MQNIFLLLLSWKECVNIIQFLLFVGVFWTTFAAITTNTQKGTRPIIPQINVHPRTNYKSESDDWIKFSPNFLIGCFSKCDFRSDHLYRCFPVCRFTYGVLNFSLFNLMLKEPSFGEDFIQITPIPRVFGGVPLIVAEEMENKDKKKDNKGKNDKEVKKDASKWLCKSKTLCFYFIIQ